MRLMTKQYGPRDLREACSMPREDALWFMEHCADAWDDDIIAWCDTTVERDALRQRLEALIEEIAHWALYGVTQEQLDAAIAGEGHKPYCPCSKWPNDECVCAGEEKP